MKSVATGRGVTLIHRTENEGMDVACHNVTLSYLRLRGKLRCECVRGGRVLGCSLGFSTFF